MSTYVDLLVNNKPVFSYRNEVSSEIFQLFSDENLYRLIGKEAVKKAAELNLSFDGEDFYDEERPLLVLVADAKIIKQRLKALGFNLQRVKEAWKECVKALVEYSEERISSPLLFRTENKYEKTYREAASKRLRHLNSLDFDVWLEQLKEAVDREEINVSHTRFEADSPFSILENLEEGLILTAILNSVEDGSKLVLDLTELEVVGWLDSGQLELGRFDDHIFRQYSPPIIITEGVYDRKVLIETLSLLYPDLLNYIRFLNMDEYKPEGGVGSIIKMVKSFISAGIANRILVVFDNDTAAKEALISLKGIKIPSHFKFIHYPALTSLDKYPTIGPQGIVEMNINGLAGSIELYLGEDVLLEDDGSYIPVQWTGYSERVKKYQGEITRKLLVQQLFDTKLKTAKKDPYVIKYQDWVGVKSIWDTIIDELSTL
jgi:hypothetical protein